MKNLIILILLSLTFSLSFAGDSPAEVFQKKIKALVEKNYSFFAYKKGQIHYLTGKNRFKEISYSELIEPKQFTKIKVEIDPKGIASDIIYFSKEKLNILTRKEKKFFKLIDSKFVPFDIEKNEREFFKE